MMEATASAGFLVKDEKLPWVRFAIRKLDTLKLLLMVLWETKSLRDKRYIALSTQLNDIGKMLGGWHGQLLKNSAPPKRGEN
ncbi:MAG: four helix bundle protein [Patescibacteria group bacterium]